MKKKTGNKKIFTPYNVFIIAMLAWPMIHFLVFSVGINLGTLVMSTYRYEGETAKFVGFQNYVNILQDIFVYKTSIRDAIFNSFSFLPLNVFVILPLSIFFSYFMYKKIAGYKIYRVIFFLPSIVSVVVLVMAYQYMFDSNFGPITKIVDALGMSWVYGQYGWFGTHDSAYFMLWLFLFWSGFGYNLVLVQGAMIRVPQEIIESGRLDGVGMFRELFVLIVPMIFPTLSTMILFGAMSTFNVFVQPQLMFGMTIEDRLTIPLMIVNMTKNGGYNGQVSAAALGVLVTLVGAPLMIGLRSLLNKVTPDVEF